MQILVENGSYHMLNMGDVAMLQVLLERLQERWPAVRLRVMTLAPERLELIGRREDALSAKARDAWLAASFLPIARRWLPWQLRWKMEAFEKRLQLNFPRLAQAGKLRASRRNGGDREVLRGFYETLSRSDALVSCGGGLINDWFAGFASALLDTFALAQRLGKPTAIFGLGLGPLQNPDLREKAARVLSRLDVLALREGRTGLPLLRSLGVPVDRVVVTGDDAIELAYRSRPDRVGQGIGINLRLAEHSQVPPEALPRLKAALLQAAESRKAPLIPAPVMLREPGSDLSSVRQLLEGASLDPAAAERIALPQDLIVQVARCRVVVSGAYHSSVFSLAMGIPVIALARSEYYVNKLSGLAEQFGVGCQVIPLDAPDLERLMLQAIDEAWETPQASRDRLLQAAEEQVLASRVAYVRFFERIEGSIRRSYNPSTWPGPKSTGIQV